MTTPAQLDTRLHGRWLIIARAAWVALAVFSIAYYVFWSIYATRQPLPTCALSTNECNPIYLSVEDVAVAPDSILPIEWIARSFSTFNVLVSLVSVLVALFIIWRKSDDGMALFVSATILSLGAVGISPDTTAVIPPGSLLYGLESAVASFGYFAPFAALFFFPDGQFAPRWSRWVCLALVIVVATFFFVSDFMSIDFANPLWIVLPVFLFLCISVGIGCMIYRYRWVASALQRQQIKWVALGLLAVSASVIAWLLYAIFLPPERPNPTRTLLVAVAFPIIGLLNAFLPVSFATAIVRYRLWDIDLLIRRTLQYSVLSGLLALTYFGLIIILQSVFTAFGGQRSELVTVASTLAIAALFFPLRKRVQDFIDRRFFRQKYDAQKVLAEFAATCRDETDLDKLTTKLVEVVEETMQPESASVWLKQ